MTSLTAPSKQQRITERSSWSLANLRRVTTSASYIAEIDGLRLLAISATVLYHVYQFIDKSTFPDYESTRLNFVLRSGYLGVPLFFIISGFVLGLPFAKQYFCGSPAVVTREFFMRRLTRIEPPYILTLILFYILANAFSASNAIGVGHLISGIFYTHFLFYGGESGLGNPINMVAWSLEVEIQFYLLAPLLSRLFAIRGKAARRGAMQESF